MRLACLALLSLAACGNEDLTRLDGREAPTEGDGVVEVRHAVDLRVERGEVRLWVTRVFRNDGAELADLDRAVALPEGAVVSGLRVLVGGQWQGGELLPAQAASDRWAELVAPGEAAPLPMALLEWNFADEVHLKYWPLEAGSTATVEYELTVPPAYSNGAWFFDYPHPDAQSLDAIPEFVGAARLRSVGIGFEAVRAEADENSGATPPVVATKVRIARPDFDTLSARWATRSFGGPNTYWGLELDVAARLAPAPVRPHVVFAVDASWSQAEEGLLQQRALIEGFLEQAPDAEVEIVVYRRFASRLFGRFVPAAEVRRALEALPPGALAPGNGSNLDAAAALAAQVLLGVSGPSRLVLFTDELNRPDLGGAELSAALAALPRETVVHVVNERRSYGNELKEVRSRSAKFVDAAESHGGVALEVSGQASAPGQAGAVMRGLVRPVRIDEVQVEDEGLEVGAPEILDEGAGLRLLGFAPRAPRTVRVRGLVWARAVEQTLAPDGDLVDRLAALSLGAPHVRTALSDAETLVAAQAARAVSSQTSYLSTAPQAQSSVLGTETLSGLGLSGCGGSSSCGAWGSSSHCTGWRADPAAALRPLLEVAASGCAARDVEVEVQATLDEIVGVSVRAAEAAQAACLTEAIWALRLPAAFSADAATVRTRLP